MNAVVQALLTTAIAAVSGQALAGWHSGGGELFSDSQNPWFIQNTTEVTYCIEIDAMNFGQTIEVGRSKIKRAIAYWRDEFAVNGTSTDPRIKLGTQNFREVDCSNSPDITFQLGTLTDEQAAYLKHPQKVVGEAVRTEYDPVQLKGKGFIYISPESGPYALRGYGPIGPIVPNRWAYEDGVLLEQVLVHELGHVFGLGHIDDTIMSADIPAFVVSYPIAYGFVSNSGSPWMFARQDDIRSGSFKTDFDAGELDADLQAIFGLADATRAIETRPLGNNIVGLYAYEAGANAPRFVGQFKNDGSAGGSWDNWANLYLTPAQRVLTIPQIPEEGYALPIYLSSEARVGLVYQALGSTKASSFAVQMRGGELDFTGAYSSGRIVMDMLQLSNFDWSWQRVPQQDPHAPHLTKAGVERRPLPKVFQPQK